MSKHILEGVERTREYELVTNFYAEKVAQRSQVYKIHHITEGVYLLGRMPGVSLAAKRAFCLHPMMQDDGDLWRNAPIITNESGAETVLLAMEYRDIANRYLPTRDIDSIDDIKLSLFAQVNSMLMADKIQNRKDFNLYLRGKIKNSDRLDTYFSNWFQRLGITDADFDYWVEELTRVFPDHTAPPGRYPTKDSTNGT